MGHIVHFIHPIRSAIAARHARAAALALCAALATLFAPPARLAAQAPAAPAAATGTITGAITAADTHLPLSDVTVRVEGTRLGALTGADGRFTIAGVPVGEVAVVAQRMGLAPARRVLTLAAGDSATLHFALAPAAAVIAPVVVSATREAQRRADASVAIDVVGGTELRLARASHPAAVMNRLPGVHVSELSGEGHSMAIRQPITTKPMYLYLEDGVPTRATGFFNHNALYEVNLPQAGGLEVLKGPGTALYGSDAIGGVVNVLTRAAPRTPGAELSVEGGDFGYRRFLGTGGFTRGADGVRADLNLTRGDNWKDRAPYDRTSATVRWDHLGAAGWMLKTVLTGSAIDQRDVPPLSRAQFDGDRSLNRAPIAYRDVRALRLSSALDIERGSSLWSITPYARYDVLDVLPTWQLSYDPQTWDTRNSSLGLLLKYRRDFAPLRARVIAGADVDWSPGSFVAKRAVTTAQGPDRIYESYTDGETQYDYDVTYRALSPYLHAELSPVRRLRVDAGLRYDASGYAYRTALAPVDTGAHRRPADTEVSYRHLSPKLGLTLEITPSLSAFASWRHGFRAPSQSQLFQQSSAANTVGLRPVMAVSREAGLRGQAGGRLVWQLSAYDMIISDDIVTFITSENRRVATNAGETRRRGMELGLGAALASWARLDASWAVSSQRYVEWTPQAARPAQNGKPATPEVSYDGMRIEQAPRDLGSVLLTFTPRVLKGGRIAAEWSHTGRYAMDPANTHWYGGHETISLHANYWVAPQVELFARGVNVTDRAYAELAAYDPFQQEQLTPGAPRALFAGVRWNVGK